VLRFHLLVDTLVKHKIKIYVVYRRRIDAVGVIADEPALTPNGESVGLVELACWGTLGAGVAIDPEDVVPARGVGDDSGGGPRRFAAGGGRRGGHATPNLSGAGRLPFPLRLLV